MQKVVCFTTKLDEFGDYVFDKTYFPDNQSPSEYLESNNGLYSKILSVLDGGTTYIIYGVGDFTEGQKEQVKEDWQRFCS